jgi:cobalt/nickel transport system permease protein
MVLVLWSVELALVPTLTAAAAGLAGSLCFAAVSGALRDRGFYGRLLAANGFLVFIWLLLPLSFSAGGERVFSFRGLAVTGEGLALSGLITLKALGITTGAMALTRATPALELLAAARSLGAPERAVALTLMTVRYISVVGREYQRLRNAMKVRGFSAKISLHTLRSFGSLAGMLLVRGIERAERVRAAMLCRGWTGRFWIRTGFRFRSGDLGFAFLALALSAAAAFFALPDPASPPLPGTGP